MISKPELDVDEWSQEQFLENSALLKSTGVKVILIDTVASPIDGVESLIYNPPLMKNEPKGTVFVFYCDTGKSSKERLGEFRAKFPDFLCISLRGGRAYWNRYLRI